MNSLKHITDWPAAGSSVDWKGGQKKSNFQVQEYNDRGCASCSNNVLPVKNLSKNTFSNSNNKVNTFQYYRIKRVGMAFMDPDVLNTGMPGSGSTTVVEFQLQYQDNTGNPANIDAQTLGDVGCQIDWYVEYQSNPDNPNLDVMVCKSWPGGPCGNSLPGGPGQIINDSKTTRIYLVTNTVNVEQFVTLGVNLQGCNSSTWAPVLGSNPRKSIKLTNQNFVGPGDLDPCPVEINGPRIIDDCEEVVFYSAISQSNPYYSHDYQWEINNPHWTLLPGKTGNDFVQLIPPSPSFLSMNPEHRFVKLCVRTTGSGCLDSTNCIWVRSDCKPEIKVNPNIFDDVTRWGVRGEAETIRSGTEFEVDWPAIHRKRGMY